MNDTQSGGSNLTAPNAVSDTFNISKNKDHTFIYTVTAIETNVVVRPQGSQDGTNWYHLDDSQIDTTITANGTYMDHKSNFAGHLARILFVSESGGTAVVVATKYTGGKRPNG